ncbi:hypothetical protein BAY59_09900 [Prauserella coralliicola]|uniref:Nuclear transport factor 2 family protein n=1 Tax=Prauserella endophytica TaxID=1592324 RepID=A0ABY2S5H5_9PSEU|nr:hypothetical protein BAY59_09900 [Prauserella coralliicola]TKG70968.1 nuclear transport factor 2 family protein [Prauserella endophytica]
MRRHQGGRIVERLTSTDAELRQLRDRAEIADLCTRYAYALDRKDWVAVAETFLDDAVFEHPGGRLRGAEAIVHRARTALERLDATQHLIGSITVAVDGDSARARCYFHAQHVRAGTPGGELYTIAGSYADRLVRTTAGWRIAERLQEYSWRSGNRQVVSG